MRIKYKASHFDNSAALYAGFAALAALMIAIVMFVSHETQLYDDARNIVKERQLLYQVYIDLLDAETGQRGYLLTSDKAYLIPYNTSVGRVAADFKDLSDVTVSFSSASPRNALISPCSPLVPSIACC